MENTQKTAKHKKNGPSSINMHILVTNIEKLEIRDTKEHPFMGDGLLDEDGYLPRASDYKHDL